MDISRGKRLLRLFLDFFKFGCFTFGGGWSIVAQMQQLFVEKRGLLSNEELLDLASVGRSLPGQMVANVAMMFGYRMEGLIGGLVCTAGLVIPPMLVLTVVSCFYALFRINYWVAAVMLGIRACVIPIVISAVVKMARGAYSFPPLLIVSAVALLLYTVFDVDCVVVVLFGALSGLVLSSLRERGGRAD